ncbi:hypothetical protein JYG23_07245 [Sedimentibacter sp. zth1]|uniref:hypothetical protein n=1 Tax=Sedimentibacter sp. zth1 TaxID=2816908 RepID=UPI001A93A0C8|nr:hypothetical protein [Sedimentibacter sp. zth1]QSX07131.1 hypothetical protein JYG23_07245 [Sedimentibacter sp. zth1]
MALFLVDYYIFYNYNIIRDCNLNIKKIDANYYENLFYIKIQRDSGKPSAWAQLRTSETKSEVE